jgi:predicted transcriptional regulator
MKKKILSLRKQGYTYSEIVEEVGCAKGTVSYHCNNAGLGGGGNRKLDDDVIEEMRSMRQNGIKPPQICEELDVSPSSVSKYTKRPQSTPNIVDGKKKCTWCEKEKDISKFYDRPDRKGVASHCKKCVLNSQKEKYRKRKKNLMNWAGNECLKCGYNTCISALEFHHENPEEKEFNVKNKVSTYSLDTLKEEARKCTLLCANCHRELECKKSHN